MTPPSDFRYGTKVVKATGDYRYPGTVRAVFQTKAGKTRLVVEADHPDIAGMLHIFTPEQMSVMPEQDDWQKDLVSCLDEHKRIVAELFEQRAKKWIESRRSSPNTTTLSQVEEALENIRKEITK